jgi:hypothetical protein
MSTAPHVPAPPQGPGVQPPFPAPPVEGRGRRIGLGLAIGAGVLVLICGGGVAALFGVLASGQGALQERADVAISTYLDAVHDKKYEQAYELLCERAQRDETAGEFRERVAAEEIFASYKIGKLDVVTMSVPVNGTYADGDVVQARAYLGQDPDTGDFEVCELGE